MLINHAPRHQNDLFYHEQRMLSLTIHVSCPHWKGDKLSVSYQSITYGNSDNVIHIYVFKLRICIYQYPKRFYHT